ncbi:hypothetical protein PFFCH_05718, partial [Plasmodium falciparum FCH/4]
GGEREAEEKKEEEKEEDTEGKVQPPPAPTQSACEIVDGILKGKDKNRSIENCKHKYDPDKQSYPKWNCTNKIKPDNDGACMPPRRIKLCVINLKYLNEKISPEELRKAFIQCAAVETFFLWHKYKDDKKDEKKTDSGGGEESPDVAAQKKLEIGTIPEDFKRQMFYTFGDFRDLCLDKNIGSDVSDVQNYITAVFQKIGQTSDQQRQNWWTKYAKDIWDGMVCALSHASGNKDTVRTQLTEKYAYPNVKFSEPNGATLPTFAQTPQFLRWFIEWSDYFCAEQAKRLVTLKENCPAETCTNGEEGKKKCSQACGKYKSWLETWKTHYIQQSRKFVKDKKLDKYKETPAKEDVEKATHAYQYLHEQLQKLCPNGNCSCMNDPSKEPKKSPDGSTDIMPASLDDVPEGYEGRCDCTKALPPSKLPEVPETLPSACEIVETLIAKNNDGNTAIGGCNPKNKGNNYPKWKCGDQSLVTDNNTCMPPRRIKLCLYYLTESISGKEKLKEAFIKCAAAETFFSWHYYKIKNDNSADEKLKKGDMPPEFLRSMFYTFGDYRDLCLNTDISKKIPGSDVNTAKTNIDNVFKSGESRETWWNENGPKIWEGMLCALQKASGTTGTLTTKYPYHTVKFSGDNSPTLEKFAQTPQFLRWFTEWGEDFCREQKKEFRKLVDGCNGYECNGDNGDKKKKCNDACQKYKKFISEWKPQYEKQIKKYGENKDKIYSEHHVAKDAKDARDYLDKTLEKICSDKNGDCEYKCMKNVSTQSLNNTDMPASLDDEPEEVQ